MHRRLSDKEQIVGWCVLAARMLPIGCGAAASGDDDTNLNRFRLVRV